MYNVQPGDGAGLRLMCFERLRVERLTARPADDLRVGTLHEHDPARHLVRLVADVLLGGLDRGGLHVGFAEMGSRDARPFEDLGERLAREPLTELLIASTG